MLADTVAGVSETRYLAVDCRERVAGQEVLYEEPVE
jgi:hypothetical protein